MIDKSRKAAKNLNSFGRGRSHKGSSGRSLRVFFKLAGRDFRPRSKAAWSRHDLLHCGSKVGCGLDWSAEKTRIGRYHSYWPVCLFDVVGLSAAKETQLLCFVGS